MEHRFYSVKTGATKVPYVEKCVTCGWLDAASLEWWADNAIKESLSERAQRIAVSVGSKPFAFVQSSSEELEIQEVLLQALAAIQTHGAELGATGNASTGQRETAIYKALVAEVERFQRLALEDAATRAVNFIHRKDDPFKDEEFLKGLREAIEKGNE